MRPASSPLENIPWGIVFLVIALSVVSVFNLHSTGLGASNQVHLSQLSWLGIGFVLMAIVAFIDSRLIQQGTWFFYGAIIILLALVLVFGTEVNGSRRWLDLGVIRFQPSELAKLAVILSMRPDLFITPSVLIHGSMRFTKPYETVLLRSNIMYQHLIFNLLEILG